MPAILLLPLFLLATVALLAWLFVFFHPARPWDFQPVGDDGPPPDLPEGLAFPAVCVLVPARNEAAALPRTLPALLGQDYPGPLRVFLIDDRSTDGTAEIARKLAADAGRAERLTVIGGKALPPGWMGKVWALDQGARAAGAEGIAEGADETPAPAEYFLLTDADILHAPGSLRRLVSESLAGKLALNSRMARLRCQSPAERLLIPAFVYFFNLLYPMRRVNHPADPLAAAAGGCVLLAREALARLSGGIESIRGEIIDDVNLARQVKGSGLPIRLSLSRTEVRSLREYARLSDVWNMVRRTAFTELKYSWTRLALALMGLGLLFVVPLLAVLAAAGGLALGGLRPEPPLDPATADAVAGLAWRSLLCAGLLFKGVLALALMRIVYGPAILFFELGAWRGFSLPLAGFLYGLMTVDSALRHAQGRALEWRENAEKPDPAGGN